MKYRLLHIFLMIVLAALFTINAEAGTFNMAGIRLTKKVMPLREIKRQHVVGQSLDFTCGAAGLSTLLNFYLGDPVSEQEIIEGILEYVPIEKVLAQHGFSLLNLKQFAESRGYDVTGYQMSVEFLRDLKVPVLVPIKFKNYSHFVIVKDVIADRVFIADPVAGNMSLKITQFEKMWGNGIGLVITNPDRNWNETHELQVKEKDLIVSDYRNLARLINQSMIRTAIFPSEF